MDNNDGRDTSIRGFGWDHNDKEGYHGPGTPHVPHRSLTELLVRDVWMRMNLRDKVGLRMTNFLVEMRALRQKRAAERNGHGHHHRQDQAYLASTEFFKANARMRAVRQNINPYHAGYENAPPSNGPIRLDLSTDSVNHMNEQRELE